MIKQEHFEQEPVERRDARRPVPAARPLSDFAVERIDDDLIILDSETLQYHTLNGAASQIWRLCDGNTTPAAIADQLGMTVDLVEITVADLGVAGLLERPADSFSWTSTMNRRRAMKLVAAGSAGAIGLPVVLSLTAPSHQAAATILTCSVGVSCLRADINVTCGPVTTPDGLCLLVCLCAGNSNNCELRIVAGTCVGALAPVVSAGYEDVKPYSPAQRTDTKPPAETVDSAPPPEVPADEPVTTDLQTVDSAPPPEVPAEEPVTTGSEDEPVTTGSEETPNPSA